MNHTIKYEIKNGLYVTRCPHGEVGFTNQAALVAGVCCYYRCKYFVSEDEKEQTVTCNHPEVL